MTDAALERYCGELARRYVPNGKILLVQIPQFSLESFNSAVARNRGYYAYPPTGLQYLAQSLEHRKWDVRILDLNVLLLKRVSEDSAFEARRWLELLDEYLGRFDPFLIGISCMFDAGIKPLMEILDYLKTRDRSVVVAGGVIATYEWKNLLKRQACHLVVKGEGESKFNYVLDLLLGEFPDAGGFSGICFRDSGQFGESAGRTDPVQPRGDLIQTYDQIPIESYCRYGSLNPFSRMVGADRAPYAAIQLNRGCRAACTFCAVRDFNGLGVRMRPVEELVREMEFLIERRGVRHFEWLDDDLLFYKKEFLQFLRAVIDRRWTITWSANNGLIAASIDAETLRLMRDSGCVGFKIGIETGNAGMLKKVRKPGSLPRFRQFAGLLRDYPEIFVGGNFIVGFPGETVGLMMDSFRFHLELNLDWAAFTVCQIIRGATAFSDFEDYFEAQMSGASVKNFIPSRNSPDGQWRSREPVARGYDVFRLDSDLVPTEDQVREIWFSFNLVGNYIHNKNLRPGAAVSKFIAWVEMAQCAYPTNPYMSLFLALAYGLKGDSRTADEHYRKMTAYVRTEYWSDRFRSFGLSSLIETFPRTEADILETLEELRARSAACVPEPEGAAVGRG